MIWVLCHNDNIMRFEKWLVSQVFKIDSMHKMFSNYWFKCFFLLSQLSYILRNWFTWSVTIKQFWNKPSQFSALSFPSTILRGVTVQVIDEKLEVVFTLPLVAMHLNLQIYHICCSDLYLLLMTAGTTTGTCSLTALSIWDHPKVQQKYPFVAVSDRKIYFLFFQKSSHYWNFALSPALRWRKLCIDMSSMIICYGTLVFLDAFASGQVEALPTMISMLQ